MKFTIRTLTSFELGSLCKWIHSTGDNPEIVLECLFNKDVNRHTIFLNESNGERTEVKIGDVIRRLDEYFYVIN